MLKRTKSLSFRIVMLCMTAVFSSILIIGWISISAIKREGDQDTSRHMNLVCDDNSKSLNEFLLSVEQSVGMVARFAAEDISSIELVRGGVVGTDGFGVYDPEKQPDDALRRKLEDYLSEHIQHVLTVFRSTANHTHGAYSYYYRLSPELAPHAMGVWYGRKNDEGRFSMLALTDLAGYSQDDVTHVGWYYVPLTRGAQTWLSPYYNENLGEKILSFVVPVYKSGTFIGIVGMDIRYETLVEHIRDIRVFDTGYAYLTEADGEIVYHPYLEPGRKQDELCPDLLRFAAFFDENDGTGEKTIPCVYDGERKELAYNTLANGMKLFVVAPSREINASWHHLVNRILIAGLALLVLFGFIMNFTINQVTNPLRRLTLASRHLAEGNYDVELDYDREDEVGLLTDAFKKLTAHLQIYISDLNSRIYRDAMTGVRNKGAFEISVRRLNDQLVSQEGKQRPGFAIVMFDCDGLKKVNDDYGHEKGDLYLQNACRLICRVFAHSPVFRIGGDELVALLEKETNY